MDLVSMSNNERFDWMRKRHKFLHEMVNTFTSLEDFAKYKDEWFALLGVQLTNHHNLVSIDMWLDYGEYETYYIIPDGNGHLTVSEVISWQDDCCANSSMNIFTLKGAEDDEIFTAIHDYSQT